MKQNNLLKNFIPVLVILFLGFSALNISAKGKLDNDETVALVIKNLTAKIKKEMSPQNISVNFVNVEKRAGSRNEVVLSGSGSCLIKESNALIPIEFEAKLNTANGTVKNISYTFLDSEFAPPTEEDFLMKHLLNQIGKDYKTTEVVIAINGYETKENELRQKEFVGTAEVRIGQLEWRKINFDVITADDAIPIKVEYDFEK